MWVVLLLVGCAALASPATGKGHHDRLQRAAQHYHPSKPVPPPPVHSKPPPKPLPPPVPPPPVHSKPPPKPYPPQPPPPYHSKPPPPPPHRPQPPPPHHSKPPPPPPKPPVRPPHGPQVQPVRPPGKHHRRSVREAEEPEQIIGSVPNLPFETFFIRRRRSAPARANAPKAPLPLDRAPAQGPKPGGASAKSAPARRSRAVQNKY